MNVIKQYWFPAAVTVLVAVIAFNLYTIYNQTVGNPAAGGAAQGPGKKRPSVKDVPAEAGPGIPRSVALAVAPKRPETELNSDALKQALQTIGAVKEAHLKGESPTVVRLTIVEPVKLSLLSERLDNQGATVVEDGSPLHGHLRLHVSGMT